MKTIKFKADGRKAQIVGEKHVDAMKDFFSYSAPGARYSPAFRAGVWDGKISMMKNGIVHVGLLRGMKEELLKNKWKVKIDSWKNRPTVEESKKGIVSKEEKYAYQNKCVDAMLEAVKWGGGLVLSATGTGKTAMTAMLASWLNCPILFVVDQLDLLYQAQKEMEEWLSKHAKKPVKVGVVGHSEFKPERVTSATIQTLHARRNDPKFKAWFKTVQVVIIDEIHVQMSRRNFNILDLIKPKAVFGLTATLQLRKKEVRMRALSICGPIVYEFPVKAAAEQGVLTKGCALQVRVMSDSVLNSMRPQWHYAAKSAHKMHLDYKLHVVRNKLVNNAIVEITKAALEKGYYVAVLVERLRHLGILKKEFHEYNPQVCAGAVSTESRERRKKRFEEGKARLLLATRVFTKGVNVKRLDLIIDAAQRSNKNDTMQKYGRGVRLHQEKKGLLYFDMVSASDFVPTRKGQTKPKTEKAAASRFNALKKSGIPVKKVVYSSAEKVMQEAEKMLDSVLKGKSKF